MTEFRKYLDGERGRSKKLADELGVSSSAITQWAEFQVPAERIFAVSKFTNIPIEKLRPDLLGANGAAA